MGDAMKGSFFALAEAKYAGGDSIKHTVFDNVERASLKVGGRGRGPRGRTCGARCSAQFRASGRAAHGAHGGLHE